MSKWTKGPWHYTSASVNHYVYNSNGGKVAVVGGSVVEETNARKIADARLIAAAPDLAEACQAAHDYLSCIPETAAGGDDEAVTLCRKLAAALRKAKGEA